jgi:hypothetical protein
MKAVIAEIAAKIPVEIDEIDIDQSPELRAQFAHRDPGALHRRPQSIQVSCDHETVGDATAPPLAAARLSTLVYGTVVSGWVRADLECMVFLTMV